VEELGVVSGRQHADDSVVLVIKGNKVLDDLKEGDSIAVNGVCLTVTGISSIGFSADVMPETLRRTNLFQLKSGDKVNLERALPVGGRLGGHFVSGHIDGTGIILAEKREGNARVITISAPEQVARYVVEKGSIAIDGISLTVVKTERNAFSVSIVPHTAQFTTLGFKKPGDTVNLEADMLVKYIEKLLLNDAGSEKDLSPSGNRGGNKNIAIKEGVTYTLLREKGFI
jgi:riboflavin synthase